MNSIQRAQADVEVVAEDIADAILPELAKLNDAAVKGILDGALAAGVAAKAHALLAACADLDEAITTALQDGLAAFDSQAEIEALRRIEDDEMSRPVYDDDGVQRF